MLFCNPDLSKIISKWIGTEDWVTNTEKLAELRKVIHHIHILICKIISSGGLHVIESDFTIDFP